MIIDFFTNVGPGLRNYAGQLFQPIAETATGAALVSTLSRAGIDMAVTFAPRWVGGPFRDPTYEKANEAVRDAVRDSAGRLVGFARVNPNYGEDAVREAEKCLTTYGFKGLMLDPEWENFNPTDRTLAYPLYEVARARKVPVIFHTWYSPSQPVLYWEVADDFPDLTVVISHLGGRLIADANYIGQRAKNVYLETSDNMYGLPGPTRAVGPERVLFGSFTPFSGAEVELFKVTSSDLTSAHKDMILGGNARRLLGLS